MAIGALRGFLVLFSASALIGASWSPLRGPGTSGLSAVDRYGSPVVYARLPSRLVAGQAAAIPPLKQQAAIPSTGHGGARSLAKVMPSLRNMRFGKHKGYERLVFDFSDRVDFWYWSKTRQDTLTIEFPDLQPFSQKLRKLRRSKLITAARYAKNSAGKGGKLAIGLADKSRLKRIFLMPPDKTGSYRLVIDVAGSAPKSPPSRGTAMAWGGGDSLDSVGPVMLAKLYGVPDKALAATEPRGKAGGKQTAINRPVPKATGRAAMQAKAVATGPRFDPLWPEPVTASIQKQRALALSQTLQDLINRHDRIKAARADLEAARETLGAAGKAWAPVLGITAFYGYENQNKVAGSADTSMPTREVDFSLTQSILDFGTTDASEEQAELGVAQADAILKAVVQGVVLEGLSAHYQLAGARQSLRYARLSEQNIKRQTALEDARVRRGAGLATDVLQAKAQLAGANARRVRAEGAFKAAQFRYQAVFATLPTNDADTLTLPVPQEKLPGSLTEGLEAALANSLQLEVGRLISEIARVETRRVKSSGYYPHLDLIAESKWKNDVGGTVGHQGEQIIRFEVTFPFNTGGTVFNTLEASKHAYLASSQRLADTRVLVREQMQGAWQQYRTARLTADQLRNQAELAAEFLGLARKERQLGKRSLIDVLSGETALANARADAVTAENDLAVSAWTLLSVMGTLNPQSVI
jgi:TolC family type I secretion outer membrane protein